MSLKSLVRSTLVIGSSSAATALIGMVRVKALALLVGPAGLGLLGVLAGIASAGTTLAALGTDASGTRQLALARDDKTEVSRIASTLAWIALAHGLIATLAIYLLREPLARLLLGGVEHAWAVGALGVAVALSLAAGLWIAVLQGLGKVGDIARINLSASLAGTAVGVAAVALVGLNGLLVLVIAQPLFAALLAQRSGRRIGLAASSGDARETRADAARRWRRLVTSGTPYMLSFLVLAAVPLIIRALVIRELGLEAAGHFHAAWTMSVIYVGFLLNAMSADYFPRLTAITSQPVAAKALINSQAELALAIGGTALLGILASAPLLVVALYSSAFQPAAAVIEWQALGNLMKLAGWPVAFLSMARGRAMQFLALEFAWSAVQIGFVWLWLPMLGLEATGLAFAASCAVFLGLQTGVAFLTYGFGWERRPLLLLAGYFGAAVLTLAAARHSIFAQAVTGSVLAALLGLVSLRLVLSGLGDDGRVQRAARAAFARVGWPLAPSLHVREG